MEFDDLDSGSGSQSEGGNNPAWSPFLEAIPEDVHEKVIPVLREWDSNYQNGVQKVHSEYEPYKFLKDGGIAADDVRMAMGIMEAIQNNPRDVYDSLASSFGYNSVDQNAGNVGAGTGTGEANSSGQGSSGQSPQGFEMPPEVKAQLERLQTGHDTMAQIILAEQKKQEEANQDKALRDEMEQLKSKHGNFDEHYVYSQMLNGASPEEAVGAYKALVEQIVTENRRPPAPRLLASGNGGVPGSGKIDVRKLSNQDTSALVAKYLADAKAANQG